MARSEFFYITREYIDAWCEISWDEKNKRLIVRVHEALQEGLSILTPDIPIIRNFAEGKIPLDPYVPPTESDWGFGQVLQRLDTEEPSFIPWAIDIPRVVWTENGEPQLNWKAAYNISASLNILFGFLNFMKREEIVWKSSRPQLITCRLVTEMDMHGGSLEIGLAKVLVNWLAEFPKEHYFPQIEQAMVDAYFQMWPERDRQFYGYQFKADTGHGDGAIRLDCPGDACGLFPESHSHPKDRGYNLVSHNVDGIDQQLALFAGVAATCDRARAQLFQP